MLRPRVHPAPIVAAALCLAEVLDLVGFATFQALVPFFVREWSLTNAEAGWVSGIYLVGYVVGVPVLVALTDRIDARVVFAASSALCGVASLGFALAADGFVSALAWRTLGPPAVGLVLDAVGGYGFGFVAMGAGSALTLGAVALASRAGARRRTP